MQEVTLVLEDDGMYAALEEAARKSGCTVQEIAKDALAQWLMDAELDESEWNDIDDARRDWRQNGGTEAHEFFEKLHTGEDL